MACTGHCKHCSEGEHSGNGEHIDGEIAAKAVHEICRNYNVQSLMTFGGEPLLYPEVVCKIHETAKKIHIPQRDLITNGFFSKDEKRIREVAHMLALSGVNNVLLSVDAFHQETIPLEPVKCFAKCVKETGIPIRLQPAWLVGENDNNLYNKQTKAILQEFDKMDIPIASGNIIFPNGNALKYLGEYFDGKEDVVNPYEDDPLDVWAICFNPNGDVLNGNIYTECIMDILEAYSPFE